MKTSKHLKMNLPEPQDPVDVNVLTAAFTRLDEETAVVRADLFDFDALAATLPGSTYTVKKSGTEDQPVYTETIARGEKILASRKTTRMTDGSLVVNTMAEGYGINVSKKYGKSGDGNYTGVTN